MPRPKGSKNRVTVVEPVKKAKKPVTKLEDLYDDEEEETPKRGRGRPPGSKNKVAVAPPPAPAKKAAVAPTKKAAVAVVAEPPKRRGRPPKVVEPVVEEYEEEEEEEEVDDPFMSAEAARADEDTDDFFGTSGSDDEFSEDFTGETAGSRLAAEGAHRVKCLKIVKDKTKSGDPMYIWDFAIVGGSGGGITLKLWTSLAPAARWKVIETLEAMGIEASNRVVSFKASDVVGVTAIANIVHDSYEGKINNKIVKLMSEDEAAEAGIELVD